MVRSSLPATASTLSRTASASTRRIFIRHSEHVVGIDLRLRVSADQPEDCICRRFEVTIRRWMAFMSQLRSMNSTASQSSSSGCVGCFPLRPKLNTVATSGLPKWRSHM